jgi:transcriptional regulator with XRE-family HTH domain
MQTRMFGNYLRRHRRRAGLSQRELGVLLGYKDQAQVSRHERSETLPPLVIALAYEVIFQVPVSTLFLEIHDDMKIVIEERLGELESTLQDRSAAERSAGSIARRLEWLVNRREL